MPVAVAVTRKELTPAQLRLAAGASKQPAQVRRLLAIALVLEGVPRQHARERRPNAWRDAPASFWAVPLDWGRDDWPSRNA